MNQNLGTTSLLKGALVIGTVTVVLTFVGMWVYNMVTAPKQA